ncbi:MAG TPA: GNAT family N-acetyltransferase [Alphaproteobacteria bacterium]|jgi:ribosomal protein S18 acetylase RimI-like enzyme
MHGGEQATISVFAADEIERCIGEFGALLRACVEAGAAIHFVLPFSAADSENFWRQKVIPAVRGGGRLVLVAEKGGRIAGSVQLDYDTPPNQPHRAEVAKLLVHPDFRRAGIARALMVELERLARRLGRSLITLDTRTGDYAEKLYASLGYEAAGIIQGYSRDPIADRLDAATIMYKAL